MPAAIYLRVSTNGQTTDTQERELRAAAERSPTVNGNAIFIVASPRWAGL